MTPIRHENGRMKMLRLLLFVSRLLLGVVFIASSLPKLRQPYLFLGDVYAYHMTGATLAKVIAATVPPLELVTGCLLLGGVLLGGAFGAAMLLFIVFLIAQVSAIVRGLTIGCGCFGPGSESSLVGPWTIARLCALFAAAVLGWWAWKVLRDWEAHPVQSVNTEAAIVAGI